MKTVKFLRTKSYGQTTYKAGDSISMREDHANLLQYMGIVVIEDSPVVKLPMPGTQGSILTSTSGKIPDPPSKPPEIPPAPELESGEVKEDLSPDNQVGEGISSDPSNEVAGAEADTGSDPKLNKGSAKNRKPKAEQKANENKNAD